MKHAEEMMLKSIDWSKLNWDDPKAVILTLVFATLPIITPIIVDCAKDIVKDAASHGYNLNIEFRKFKFNMQPGK